MLHIISVLSGFSQLIHLKFICLYCSVLYFTLATQIPRPLKTAPCTFPVCSVENKLLRPSRSRSHKPPVQLCVIPEVDPYHESIMSLLIPPEDPNCSVETPLLFKSTLDSELIPVISLEEFSSRHILFCCYRVVSRDVQGEDYGYTLSNSCHPVSLEKKTKIPVDSEFIAIYCPDNSVHPTDFNIPPSSSLVDLHAFVHPTNKKDEKILPDSASSSVDKPNIAILGIDAVSRPNFLRSMKKTRKFLLEKMGATEFHGFNKVGDETLPNMAALLTSLPLQEMQETCFNDHRYDECPFIWKNFSAKGYTTAYSENHRRSAFNLYKAGFIQPPTDYYFHTLAYAGNDLFLPHENKASVCLGPRLFLEVLLDYMHKFIYRMNLEGKPFFSLAWEGTLAHDHVNDAILVDEPLHKALSEFHKSHLLNNTILILMSDHGMRYGNILKHPQGKLEDMLPFLYIVLPERFKETYRVAYENLRGNVRRFSNTLDLYYTFQDLLNPSSIQDDTLRERKIELDTLFQKGPLTKIPKGISLFLPIPPMRTCNHTIINPKFCTCNWYEPVSTQDKNAVRATLYVVQEINSKLEEFHECTELHLKTVKMVQRRLVPEVGTSYQVNFGTQPGDSEFKAEVLLNLDGTHEISHLTKTRTSETPSACETTTPVVTSTDADSIELISTSSTTEFTELISTVSAEIISATSADLLYTTDSAEIISATSADLLSTTDSAEIISVTSAELLSTADSAEKILPESAEEQISTSSTKIIFPALTIHRHKHKHKTKALKRIPTPGPLLASKTAAPLISLHEASTVSTKHHFNHSRAIKSKSQINPNKIENKDNQVKTTTQIKIPVK